MAGINFGSLFPTDNTYDDEGNLTVTNPLTYASKYKSGTWFHGQVLGNTSTTLITGTADKQYWLTGVIYCAHVESDNYITCQLNIGAAAFIMTPIPGTADNMVYFAHTFPQPIKVPASTNLTAVCDHADGELAVTVFYYSEDV